MNSFTYRLLSMSRARKRALQLVVDIIILNAVFVTAMWMRLESFDFLTNGRVWLVMIPVLPITLYFFVRLGFYRAVLRYIAGRALITILMGSVLSGVAMSIVARFADLPIPAPVPAIYTVLTFVCIGGVRFGFRELINYSQNRRKERVAIYGAGAAGRQLVQILLQRSDYMPVAFIDDAKQAQGTHVGGLMVYPPSQIEALIRNNGVNVVLLAMPSATRARRNQILRKFESLPVLLRSVPGLDDIMAGKSRIDQINDIGIEDLLGRDAIPPRPELLGADIRGKVVMVTGAGGSIGSELCRQILQQKPTRLVLFELSEAALYNIQQELEALLSVRRLDVAVTAVLGCIMQERLVERTMRQFKVNTVYHAAAYKHVPMVEHNISAGIRNIVFGTKSVVEAAIATGVESFILISTDKSVRPTNIMGASKRLAEMLCQALSSAPHASGTTISMVRFGNVLGSSGSVIPTFRRQIEMGGPITVTHPDVTRFFMTIPEAAQLVIQAGAMAKGGEVFVLDMGDPVRIVELATRMVRLHGLKPILYAEPPKTKSFNGEIGIVFTRLRPGEKMHEELLIGNDPKATGHPRIMSATERHQPLSVLFNALSFLQSACERNDIDRIRAILVEQHTDYQPSRDIVDLFWQEGEMPDAFGPEPAAADQPRLTLVRG